MGKIEEFTIIKSLFKSSTIEILTATKGGKDFLLKKYYKKPLLVYPDEKISKKLLSLNIKLPEDIIYENNYTLSIFSLDETVYFSDILDKKLNLKIFFKLSTSLAKFLSFIHENDLKVFNITPNIIFFSNNKSKVTIYPDFSEIDDKSQLYTDYRYMSPEQTNRMNIDPDYRSDFYNLGVILYQYLTKRLPLYSDDFNEMVHLLFAKMPEPPDNFNSNIPELISEIISKLLSKNPEDRYRTAYGLNADFKELSDVILKEKNNQNFWIGKNDYSGKLSDNLPFINRDTEKEQALVFIKKAMEKEPNTILISGSSGIGKTALAKELTEEAEKKFKNVEVISGKYEESSTFIPYSGIITAFQSYIKKIFTRSNKEISKIKSKILSRLGNNIGHIIDYIPDLSFLLGENHYEEKSKRVTSFHTVLKEFIEVLIEDKKTILFLDNLHWLDSYSTDIIYSLLQNKSRNFCFIGTYRPIDNLSEKPLSDFIENLSSSEILYCDITLKPFDNKSSISFIESKLDAPIVDKKVFTDIVLKKTQNSPFFISQFLDTAFDEGKLFFDFKRRKWNFDKDAILQKDLTDNVAFVLLKKIDQLSKETRNILELASCIGLNFDIKTLQAISGLNPLNIKINIFNGIQKSLLLPDKDIRTEKERDNQYYKFTHSRISETVYDSISSEKKHKVHYLLFNYYKKMVEEKGSAKIIFKAVSNLNKSLIDKNNIENLKELVRMNYLAGESAINMSADKLAREYFKVAYENSRKEFFVTDYELNKNIYMNFGLVEYLSGKHNSAEEVFDKLFKHLKTDDDKASYFIKKTELYLFNGDIEKGLAAAYKVAFYLNFSIPKKITKTLITTKEKQVENLFKNLQTKNIYDSFSINKEMSPTCSFFTYAVTLSLFTDRHLHSYLTLSMLYNILKNGVDNYETLNFVLINYSLYLLNIKSNYIDSFSLASNVLDKISITEQNKIDNITTNIFCWFISPWKTSTVLTQDYIDILLKTSLLSQDRLSKASTLFEDIYLSLLNGSIVDDNFFNQFDKYISKLKEIHSNFYSFISSYIHLQKNYYTSYASLPDSMPIQDKYVNGFMQLHLEVENLKYYITFDEVKKAVNISEKYEKQIEVLSGTLPYTDFIFYSIFAYCEDYYFVGKNKKVIYLKKIKKYLRKLKKWSEVVPENFLVKYLIASAEVNFVTSQKISATTKLDQAIKITRESGLYYFQALSNERKGLILLKLGKPKVAKIYLIDSRYNYLKKGYTAKVRHLDRKYSEILGDIERRSTPREGIFKQERQNIDSIDTLDLNAVIKASSTIASETTYPRLLKKIIKIAVENAGAQKGILILNRSGSLVIEAEISIDNDGSILLSTLLDESENIVPKSIVNYCARTKEVILLSELMDDSRFRHDPYIISENPKSILCFPIENNRKLTAILYLENNLSEDVFTKDRINILKVIATQAAISIENVFLINNLEDEVSKRTKEVTDKISEIEEINKNLNEKTTHIENLLNNSSQGFLTLSEDLKVEKNYSNECIKIFGKNIADEKFTKLLYPDDTEREEFTEKLLYKIINENNRSKKEIYFSLLPSEIMIEGKHIEASFKIINDDHKSTSEKFMIILTDITEKKFLQHQMEKEKNILNMVVKVVVDYNDFMYVYRQFNNFDKTLSQKILRTNKTNESVIADIYRKIHTFKGNFSQFGMVNIVPKLHEIETEITKNRTELEKGSSRAIDNFFKDFNLSEYLEEDLSILKDILSEQFFQQESKLVLYKDKLDEFESKIVSLLPPFESKLILTEIKKLAHKPFRRMFNFFIEYVERLAEEQEKPIYPFYIENGDFPVEVNRYADFVKSLVHVFRNCIDHGIEPSDERAEKNKDEFATIKAEIELIDNTIILTITDDGQGIDPKLVAKKAVEKGLITENELKKLTEKEKINLIFEEQLTTKDHTTMISGRGVGLAAVKKEVEKLNGTIEVMSFLDIGTTFQFKIPYKEKQVYFKSMSAFDILSPVVSTAKEVITDKMGIGMRTKTAFNITKTAKLVLCDYSSIITLSGVLHGKFIITMDRSLAMELAKKFFSSEDFSENDDSIFVSMVSEFLNIVMGNSIMQFPDLEDMIAISTPYTITAKGGIVRYEDSRIWCCELETEKGTFNINFVTTVDQNSISQ